MGEEDKLEPTEAKEVVEENVTSKLARKRKKQLYNSIKQLMEFWFSDVNLGKDRFLSQLLYDDLWIDLEIFLKFNKLRALTADPNDIVKALRKSEVLQVSEDGRKVCRVTPFSEKQDADACTIYVEQIQPDVEHDWLKAAFSEFGPIDYISLPRFKMTQKPKGFAFIEFKDPESANRAIEAFRAKGCCLSPQMDPDKLASIATFEKDDKQNCENRDEDEIQQELTEEEATCKKFKKEKTFGSESESKDDKYYEVVKHSNDKHKAIDSKTYDNIEETSEYKLDNDNISERKHKRKRSSGTNDIVPEEEHLLQKPSKRYKPALSCENDYNETTKSKPKKKLSDATLEAEGYETTNIEMEAGIGSLKQKKEKRISENNEEMSFEDAEQPDKKEDENIQEEEGEVGENGDGERKTKRKRKKKHKRHTSAISFGLQIMPKIEWKRLRNKYLNLQRQKMQQLKQHLRQYQRKPKWQLHNYDYDEDKHKIDIDKNVEVKKKGLQFTPGVIIKVTLDESVLDEKEIKSKARIHPEVRYVDASEGEKEIYLRVGAAELADQVLSSKHWPKMELLQGKEEQQYWEKILRDREEKFSKKIRTNQRGRDKLLKKAEKIQGNHVGFDER